MSTLLAIDPGTSFVGWAYFEGLTLRECGVSDSRRPRLVDKIYEHRNALSELRLQSGLIVCERMVCRQGRSVGDAQDVLDVNLVAGALGRDIWLTPTEWKGNVPRDVEQQRTWDKLTPQEQALLPKLSKKKTSKSHNAWSAVGIGLSYLGRAHAGFRRLQK